MNTKSKIGTLLVTLGFVLSVVAVLAPAGAAAGRAENFVVTVTFTNADGSHGNSSNWMATDMINITANVSIAGAMENVTDLMLELTINGNLEGAPLSLGGLNATEFKEYTWQSNPPGYGDYTVMVTAVNGTDNANQTVKTLYYRSLDSDISITGVTATPAAALVGVDEVTMTAALANAGNEMGKANVTFSIGVVTIGFVLQDVPAGGTADAVLKTKFEGLSPPNGKYSVKASMTDLQPSEATSAENITLTNPVANLTITGLTVNPASGYVGDNVTFTATLKNDGTADATNIAIDFAEYVILIYMSIGELPNVTVAKGTTINVTWAYTLPTITDASETKSIRASYGAGLFVTTFKTINVTINKKMPKLEITAFSMPTGKRVYDAVSISITVKNNGTAGATGIVVKIREGSWEYTNATDPFNLSIGESKTVTLGITLMDEGSDVNRTFTAVASVGGVSSTKDSKVFIAHQIYAAIGIQSFKISPAKKDNQPKDSTQSFSATVTLKNTGEKAGSVQLMLFEGAGLSAKLLSNQTVSVDPLATKEVKVSFKVKGTGKHTITSVVSLPNPDPGNMTKAATCELQYSSPGFEVVVLFAAIVVGAVFIRRRKN